jgi:tetratricopeptide (TPR) repeat protein
MMRRFVSFTALALALAAAQPAVAQQADDDEGPATVSRPVVQPIGQNAGQQLNSALSRLARDPRNVTALVDAGNAAMALGDNDAAIGFFTRADQVAPGNGPVKAQIASAMLRGEDPLAALRWFDDAERAGADPVAMALDRGLAYDLVGDNVAAQGQYRLALSRGPNEEASRRYALSLAIAGDRHGADLMLAPLLQRQERAAWRTRTFILAITGNADEAVSIARASMPADLSAGITPYLRYMPRLTPAQQAGAANLGRFPRAADIGRDDPRVVQYAALHPRPVAKVDMAAAPQGQTLGGRRDDKSRRRRPGSTDRPVQVATATPVQNAAIPLPPPPPVPGQQASVSAATNPWNVPLQQQAQAQQQTRPSTSTSLVPSVSRPVVQPTPQPTRPAPNPGFDLAQAGGSSVTTPAPATTTARPTVLSRLDVPPGAVRPPVPTPGPVTGATPTASIAPSPAQLAQAAPQPAPTTTVSQPVVQPLPPAATPAPPPPAEDFRSLFNGFEPPADEQANKVAAVDITRIPTPAPKKPQPKVEPKPEPKVEAKVDTKAAPAKKGKDLAEDIADCEPAPKGKAAKGKPAPVVKGKRGAKPADTCVTVARGERPDGPTAVSRTEEKTGKGAKGKDAKEAKAAVSHPSRIWVQVLTGSDRDRMGSEWRGLVRSAAALKGKKPFITPWRSNFRLLTGPFESEEAAQDFLKALRKDGVSGFQWTSPAGQVVDTLALK